MWPELFSQLSESLLKVEVLTPGPSRKQLEHIEFHAKAVHPLKDDCDFRAVRP
jgi:hypothetical protein